MELWHLSSDQLWLRLNSLALTLPPLEPHDQLLLNSFMKYSPRECCELSYCEALRRQQPFAALWAELRCLGAATPLKHRDFVPHLLQLAEHNRERPAIQALRSQAELGDQDALLALLRANMECPEELQASLLSTLENLRLDRDSCERFLGLYGDAEDYRERIRHFRQVFFPEAPRFDFTPEPAPRARRLRPIKPLSSLTPRWSLREIEGIGRLTVLSKPRRVLEIGLETVRSHPRGFLYTTYSSGQYPGYAGAGDSRPIHASRVADDLSYLILQCTGPAWDLLSLKGNLLGTIPPGPWTCYRRCQKSRKPLLSGPQGLFKLGSKGLEPLLTRPVVSFGQYEGKLVTLDEGGLIRLDGRRKFTLPEGPAGLFSPNGRWLARLNAGRIEVYRHSGMQASFPAPFERELVFCADSLSLASLGKEGLTIWSLDGEALACYSEREASGQPRLKEQPSTGKSLRQLAVHDRFFDDLTP
ncbi:hypothetical protein JST97_13415 [bacterium]|nr:hypothetical protein [bacterium]